MNLVDKAILLAHPKYHQKNLSFIIETFLNNDYPLEFTFEAINTKIKKLALNNKIKSDKNKNESTNNI